MKKILASDRFRWKALLLALLVGLVFGIAQVGEPLENVLQAGRNKLRSHTASEATVLVAIDDRSLSELGSAPWDGARLAALVRRIDAAGARRIHLDADFTHAGSAGQAAQLESALAGARAEMLLPARLSIDPISGTRADHRPAGRFARHARLVNTNLVVRWDGVVRRQPYGADSGDGLLPSLAAVLGGHDGVSDRLFQIDYGVDVRTIPTVSASDLLLGRVRPGSWAGRNVVVARTDFAADHFMAPGTGMVPGILVHLVAAETLIAGKPVDLGLALPLALASIIAMAILGLRRRSLAAGLFALTTAAGIAGPLWLDEHQLHVEIVPALALIVTAVTVRLVTSLRRTYRARGTTNLLTGKPNLQALQQTGRKNGIIVAARVRNYARMTTVLPPEQEKELVDQIVGRLEFGAGGAVIYQADQGVFVWVSQDCEDELVKQLDGLQALFRSPIVIATRLIDVAVTFGIDAHETRAMAQRASSALVAADQAAREGRRWASFNPASVADAEWTMSLLASLDHAIDHDELWVAYQPKFECHSGRMIGAEALVRWTHPEKGQLYPDQFIAAAEQGGRIDCLTYFVLDRALAAIAPINLHGRPFSVAVNLSVLLLDSPDLVPTISALLTKHGVRAGLLTLEVTETSTLGSGAGQIANLEQLSGMGVMLSIDDYGTGFSTLEYLKRIPASELKIDRSFVSMLNKSQSDRIMVNSTIQLAHSLGRRVVAEGVENEETLEELRRMRCDIVQGYHTGRPVPLAELRKRLERNASDIAA